MFGEATAGSCFDRIEHRLAFDIGKITVAKEFQVGGVGIDVNPVAQYGDRIGFLLKSRAMFRIIPWGIVH